MRNGLMRAHALCGFLGVALGAFGAHALRDKVTERGLENWRTATLYLMVHALAGIVALSVTKKAAPSAFFLAGSIVFAGSLYVLVLTDVRALGAVTPVGGVCFLVGWALFAKEARAS